MGAKSTNEITPCMLLSGCAYAPVLVGTVINTTYSKFPIKGRKPCLSYC